ncbi:MAG: CoA-binding protein [Candidatus Thorarchaeota archaeon]
MTDISKLFSPDSIAVIGASNSFEKLGGVVMDNLIKSYSKTIYPINPNNKQIFGKKCYKTLNDLPSTPDLAIIALSAQQSIPALASAGKFKIPFAIIFAGGFSEIGKGSKLEDELKKICDTTGIRLVGPNCMGIWDKNLINASFMNILPKYSGKTTFISQSGSLIAFSIYLKLRLNKFVSLGNSVDLNFEDFINYLSNDRETKILVLYIESISDGRILLEKIKNFPKPIIVIKAGVSEYGQRSIASHTGALAGNNKLFQQLFKAYGVLMIESFEIMVAASRALEILPILKNNKVLALSNAGGAVCLFSDACFKFGVEPSILPNKLKNLLLKVFPPQASINNPLDLTVTGGTPDVITRVFDILFDLSLHDYGIIVYIPVVAPFADAREEAKLAIKLSKRSPLPFLVCFLAGEKVSPAIEEFDIANIAYTQTILETAEVINILWQWSKIKEKKSG